MQLMRLSFVPAASYGSCANRPSQGSSQLADAVAKLAKTKLCLKSAGEQYLSHVGLSIPHISSSVTFGKRAGHGAGGSQGALSCRTSPTLLGEQSARKADWIADAQLSDQLCTVGAVDAALPMAEAYQ